MDAMLLWILSAGLLLVGARTAWRRQMVLGTFLLVVGLALGVAGWASRDTGGVSEVSSASVERDASFVLQADLSDLGAGAHPERLVAEWIDLAGVAGTHGNTHRVLVYGAPKATVRQMDAAMTAMRAEKIVTAVIRVR